MSFNRQLLYALLVIIPLVVLIYGYEQHQKQLPQLKKQLAAKSKKIKKFTPLPKSRNKTGAPFISETMEQATGRVLRHVRPCVVNVTSFNSKPLRFRGDSFGRILEPYQAGNVLVSSGIMVSTSGDIITSYDAVPTNNIEVKLFRGKPNVFKAKIVKVDKALQLAHLKLTGGDRFPNCALGNSDKVRVGDFVYAIGSPYGFSQTITGGIVSSNRKKINIQGDIFKHMIQTDAAINKGNNGGPLVNVDGQVVGVNMATFTTSSGSTGIGFAVPINDVRQLLDGVTVR
jgi:serine protease Do